MSGRLTERQAKALDALRPIGVVGDVAARLGCSHRSAITLVNVLTARGLVVPERYILTAAGRAAWLRSLK